MTQEETKMYLIKDCGLMIKSNYKPVICIAYPHCASLQRNVQYQHHTIECFVWICHFTFYKCRYGYLDMKIYVVKEVTSSNPTQLIHIL